MPTAQAIRRLSPEVRRLLHEHGLQARAVAGVDLTETARASDGRRVTRADADLVLDQRGVGSASAPIGQTISDATPRRATSVDHLGHEVVPTRPHVTVRLHHADRATSDDATALLEELRGAIASWTLPVGP